MKYVIVIYLVLALNQLFAQQNNFSDFFYEHSLRIDYFHHGNAIKEEIVLKSLIKEEFYAGSRVNLIQQNNPGIYEVRVYDMITDKLIYSSGFSNLFEEWQNTEEAKNTDMKFPGSIIIPYPINKIRLELHKRGKNNEFYLLFAREIDAQNEEIIIQESPNTELKIIQQQSQPEVALDLVFIAEGYAEHEYESFFKDAEKFMNYMFSTEPFNSYKEQINIYAVSAFSEESGTDIPAQDIYKNTALNSSFSTFGSPRYLTTSDFFIVRNYAALVPCDQIVILVNTDEYGGGGIYNFYSILSASNEYSEEVFLHELGHSLAGLGDEYYTSDVAYQDYYNKDLEPPVANLTSLVDFESKFWSQMIDENTPIPTPVTKEMLENIGVYEGGGYSEKGIYRPYINCKMKGLYFDFCPVCQRAILEVIMFYSD
jgi:hypothetical protein